MVAKKEKIELQCELCGVAFFVLPGAIRRFCSKSCASKFSRNKISVEDRFMKFVDKNGPIPPKEYLQDGACWMWRGSPRGSKKGELKYGGFGIKYKTVSAHIFSYQFFIGDTKGLQVNHGCHNDLCVNPEHLSLGCNLGNQSSRRFSYRSKSQFTIDQVKQIKKGTAIIHGERKNRYIPDLSYWAEKFSAGAATVWKVLHEKPPYDDEVMREEMLKAKEESDRGIAEYWKKYPKPPIEQKTNKMKV